jgi:hypothetical protein
VTCLINAGLSEVPSEVLVFRDFTAELSYKFDFDVLVEVQQNVKDNYYFYLKHLGLLDFVKELVNEFEESGGIYVDYAARRPHTVVTDRINDSNYKSLVRGVAAFKS